MTILQKLYRQDLVEETINTVGFYINDKWNYQGEQIPVKQLPEVSSHAVVIGNGISGHQFDLTTFLPYRETTAWGDVGEWKIKRQIHNFYTYGCNALYRNYKPDFIVATGDGLINEIANSNYCDDNVVYVNSHSLEKFPDKFNIIPQNPEFNSGSVAAYLAAFDGHKKVFLLGFDGIDNNSDNYNFYGGTSNYPTRTTVLNEEFWVRSLNLVMKTYSDTEFIRVAPTKKFRQPEMWKYNLNYRQIDFRQFVLEAGV